MAFYEEQAALLNEWSLKPTSVCLYEFTFDKDYLACNLTKIAKLCPEFKEALLKAKERIAKNRLNLLNEGKFNEKAWSRTLILYDKLTRDIEREEKEKDADLEVYSFREKEKAKQELDLKKATAPGQALIASLVDKAKATNFDDHAQSETVSNDQGSNEAV